MELPPDPIPTVGAGERAAPAPGFVQRLREAPAVRRAMAFQRRYRRWQPLVFFFAGVTWDGATLKRIDSWVDSVILLSYILFLGALLMTALYVEHGRLTHPRALKYREWFPAAIQFLMGALFSAYFIFYLQSTSFRTASVIYLVILVILLVGNEFLHDRLVNPYFLFTLYFLATATFFIFFLPVLTKAMGYGMFWLSTASSLALIAAMLYVLWRGQVLPDRATYGRIAAMVAVLFAMLHLFYLQNWIPPVPLAIRESGIYRDFERDGDAFAFKYARPPWYAFWIDSDRPFQYTEGDTVYCFTAVFAPTSFDTEVAHIWYRYDDAAGTWAVRDTIPFRVLGGRDRGFRGYTHKRFVEPGRWRVDVKTETMHTLGRIGFEIVPARQPVTAFAWARFE